VTQLKAVPLQEPPKSPDKAPDTKRQPGRPKGSRTSTAATPKAATSSRNLKNQIGSLLVTVNMGLLIVPSMRLMALDANEIEALASAIEAQAKTSPRFKRYLETALAATAGGQLLGVAAIIGARRAARLGFFGEEQGAFVDASLGQLIAPANAQTNNNPNPKVVNDAPDANDSST